MSRSLATPVTVSAILLLALAAIFVPQLASGGSALVGKTYDISGAGTFMEGNVSIDLDLDGTITLNDDNTFTAVLQGSAISGTWKLVDGTITANVKQDAKQILEASLPPSAKVTVDYYRFVRIVEANGKIGGKYEAKYTVKLQGTKTKYKWESYFGGALAP